MSLNTSGSSAHLRIGGGTGTDQQVLPPIIETKRDSGDEDELNPYNNEVQSEVTDNVNKLEEVKSHELEMVAEESSSSSNEDAT